MSLGAMQGIQKTSGHAVSKEHGTLGVVHFLIPQIEIKNQLTSFIANIITFMSVPVSEI